MCFLKQSVQYYVKSCAKFIKTSKIYSIKPSVKFSIEISLNNTLNEV